MSRPANVTALHAPVPPQDLDAEESVLGAMLLAPAAVAAVADILTAGDFYRESHGRIYQAALDLDAKSVPVDAITLTDYLGKLGILDEVGGRQRIHELAALVPATANAAHYARTVKGKATQRGLVRVGDAIARLGWDGPGDDAELLGLAERELFGLSLGRAAGGPEPIGPVAEREFGDMLVRWAKPGELAGLSCGFRTVDRVTLGLKPSNLVVLAARPGMGKSALAITGFARHVAVQQRLPVAVFSLEMSRAELAQRFLCAGANVSLTGFQTGRIGCGRAAENHDHERCVPCQRDRAALAKAGLALVDAPLLVDDESHTMAQVRSKARREKLRHPDLALIVVDYLQQLAQGRPQDLTALTGMVAQDLKRLARELRVPVLALSQLNRQVDERPNKRPVLSDLRQSGQIEQEADVVMFLYREEYYDGECAEPAAAEVSVAKNRNGPRDTANVSFRKDFAKFTDAHLPGDMAA